MLSYFLSKGLNASQELDERIQSLAPILDVGIDRRAEIDMSQLYSLHRTLSQAIAPALPGTVEHLHWDRRNNPFYSKFAPISSLRRLMLAALIFLLLVLGLSIFGDLQILSSVEESVELENGELAEDAVNSANGEPTEEEVAEPANGENGDARGEIAFLSTSGLLLLIAMAGLGSCFSVLYDARQHVVDATFDFGKSANFTTRVFLGIISGLLLALFLVDPEDAAELQLGLPLLAFLGGFSELFVYKGLKRLVESLTSIFEASVNDRIALREKEVQLESRENALTERLERSTSAMSLAAAIDGSKSETERSDLIRELVKLSAGAPNTGDQPAANEPMGEVARALSHAREVLAAGRLLARAMPGGTADKIDTRLASISEKVDAIGALLDRDAVVEAERLATELLETLRSDDPVHEKVFDIVKALAGPAQAAGLVGGPAGLALAILTGTFNIGSDAYAKWKARILDAPYAPDLLPPDLLDDTLVRIVLKEVPELEAALPAEIKGSNAALLDLARLAVEGEDDAVFGRMGGALPNRDQFDRLIGRFRTAVLENSFEDGAVPQEALDHARVASAKALFRELDQLRSGPDARSGLDQLFLLAAEARRTGDRIAIDNLSSMIRSIASPGTRP